MKIYLIIIAWVIISCANNVTNDPEGSTERKIIPIKKTQIKIENKQGKTIPERFNFPDGFNRKQSIENSFAHYLRTLPLKPANTPIYLFNGNKKANQNAHAAVIDIDTGNRDLQQCADAVMRLRAEYLFSQKKYDDIQFNFVNGFKADYKTWRAGHRISVKGNEVKWVASSSESTSYKSFRKYLNMVFAYAGTPSLEKEMKNVPLEEMQIGDVFIQGGSPGHAVVVVDMAVNENNGNKIFMLAQSYMPAQDIHVLINPSDELISPWYELNFEETLITPEWRFNKSDLYRFK